MSVDGPIYSPQYDHFTKRVNGCQLPTSVRGEI